jgi:hypothetical protein
MAIQQLSIGAGDLISVVTATTTNLNISTLFGNNYSRPQNKTVVIESGVTIGSNSVGSAALVVPSGGSGLIKIINKGSIQGAGGAAGSTGGDAVLLQTPALLINEAGAFIYAGGGGGGAGGAGGTGGAGSYTQTTNIGLGPATGAGSCDNACVNTYGGGAYCANCEGRVSGFNWRCGGCQRDVTQTISTSGGSGGAGGSGGRGRGYDGSATSGSVGSAGAAGGTNAGTGGTGGTGGSGGDWGASGSTGNTGTSGSNGNVTNGLAGVAGSAGGLAGFYINGLSTYATFTNLGTVAGRTN